MAINRTYKLPHRRRREQKTDYKRRLALLKSNKIRFVVRKSVGRTIAQAIEYNVKGDKILTSVSSNELQRIGWKGNSSNLKSAYLTGFILGVQAKNKGITEMILDTGLQRTTKGGRLFATLKGALDAGITIPHSKEILPTDEKVGGEEIEKIKQAIK